MPLAKKIVVASLTALFFVFSVGLPVIQYFCPMAGMDRACCDMTPGSTNTGVALTTSSYTCCGTTIVAERNTTPFVEVVKYQPASFDLQVVLHHAVSSYKSPSAPISFIASGVFERGAPPLFLQNSALLL
ncbi:MAG: hypothetical protein WBD36_07340 [Bacteroidota bacterium]